MRWDCGSNGRDGDLTLTAGRAALGTHLLPVMTWGGEERSSIGLSQPQGWGTPSLPIQPLLSSSSLQRLANNWEHSIWAMPPFPCGNSGGLVE